MGTPNTVLNTTVNTTLTAEQLAALKVEAIKKGHRGLRAFVTEALLALLEPDELDTPPVGGGVVIRPAEEHPGDEWHCLGCFRWHPAEERRGRYCVHCE
jgi:hypothetical protein